MSGSKVVVFGSFVVDLMGRAKHLPRPGETVMGNFFKQGPGGKGFNQGVAAHKAGADAVMITKIGRDLFADIPLSTMDELEMDKSYIMYSEDKPTGVALINVDEFTSENQILVVPGACADISDEDLEGVTEVIQNADYLLTQLETNLSSIEKVINLAYEAGTKIVLNTAPIQPIPENLLEKVYIVTPNEVEAEYLTGIKVNDLISAKSAAVKLKDMGVDKVVITLGKNGVFISDEEYEEIIPAFPVAAVDTTGAGDAFNGGFITALTEGKSLKEAAIFGNAVGALSVQKLGTTPSMPTRAEIDKFIKSNKKD